MGFACGEKIGPYEIVEQQGQGGMATVFKAYHAALDRHVAIKALNPAYMEDPSFLARFQREARVVARLEHPNIVPIYDAAEHEGRPYLVMKFIQGETLKQRLKRGPLPLDEGLHIIKAVDHVKRLFQFSGEVGLLTFKKCSLGQHKQVFKIISTIPCVRNQDIKHYTATYC